MRPPLIISMDKLQLMLFSLLYFPHLMVWVNVCIRIGWHGYGFKVRVLGLGSTVRLHSSTILSSFFEHMALELLVVVPLSLLSGRTQQHQHPLQGVALGVGGASLRAFHTFDL